MTKRTTGYNSAFVKGGVSCSADIIEVKVSAVLHHYLSGCAENTATIANLQTVMPNAMRTND